LVQRRFVPLVRDYLSSKKLEQKAVLILDNAPCHPVILKSEDNMINCLFLPPNTTSLIQPMDQCVISALKRAYRRQLIHDMLLDIESNENFNIEEYVKKYDIRHCIDNISQSWDQLSARTLKNAWSKIGLNEFLGDIAPTQTMAEYEEQVELKNAI
jgi:hypothetical protein